MCRCAWQFITKFGQISRFDLMKEMAPTFFGKKACSYSAAIRTVAIEIDTGATGRHGHTVGLCAYLCVAAI
jgi:hypothetical protein